MLCDLCSQVRNALFYGTLKEKKEAYLNVPHLQKVTIVADTIDYCETLSDAQTTELFMHISAEKAIWPNKRYNLTSECFETSSEWNVLTEIIDNWNVCKKQTVQKLATNVIILIVRADGRKNFKGLLE